MYYGFRCSPIVNALTTGCIVDVDSQANSELVLMEVGNLKDLMNQ